MTIKCSEVILKMRPVNNEAEALAVKECLKLMNNSLLNNWQIVINKQKRDEDE